jgi:hypothetical protein
MLKQNAYLGIMRVPELNRPCPSLIRRPGLLRSRVLCLLLVAGLFSLALALISELLLLGQGLDIHLHTF